MGIYQAVAGRRPGRGNSFQFAPDSPSFVRWKPLPHPDDVVADAILGGTTLATLPPWEEIPDTKYENSVDGSTLTGWTIDASLEDSGDQTINAVNFAAKFDSLCLSATSNIKYILPPNFGLVSAFCTKVLPAPYYMYIESNEQPIGEGIRISPSDLVAANAATLMPQYQDSVPLTLPTGTRGLRFVCLRFLPNPAWTHAYTLLSFAPSTVGDNGGMANWDTDRTDAVVVDRCELKGGDPGGPPGMGVTTQRIRDAIRPSGSRQGVVDSFLHGFSDGTESHTIICLSVRGLKLDNNYMSVGSSMVFLGGGIPDYGVQYKPQWVVVRHNEFDRPLAYIKTSTQWDGITGRYIKNNMESKNSKQTVFEGNTTRRCIIDGGGQYGQLWGIKSAADGPFQALLGGVNYAGTEDCTVRYNDGRDCNSMLALEGADDVGGGQVPPGTPGIVTPVTRLSFYHNRADRVGTFEGAAPGHGQYLFSEVHHDCYVGFNTVVAADDGDIRTFYLNNPGMSNLEQFLTLATNLSVSNNIFAWGYVNVDGSARVPSFNGTGQNALNLYASSYYWNYNCAVTPDTSQWNTLGNTFSPDGTVKQVAATSDIGFVDLPNRDMTLSGGSPFKGMGLGGRDPGCNNADVIRFTTLNGQRVGILT